MKLQTSPKEFRVWNHTWGKMIYFDSIFGNQECNPIADKIIGPSLSEAMQYTGLKDKEGKKIFEGDILSLKQGLDYPDLNFVVNYDLEEAGYFLEAIKKGCDNATLENSERFKLVGNIFEHPELLEGK